jgi:hypothetical protein
MSHGQLIGELVVVALKAVSNIVKSRLVSRVFFFFILINLQNVGKVTASGTNF